MIAHPFPHCKGKVDLFQLFPDQKESGSLRSRSLVKKPRSVCRVKRQRGIIIFGRGVYVAENTFQSANVRRKPCAAALCKPFAEKPAGFSASLERLPAEPLKCCLYAAFMQFSCG